MKKSIFLTLVAALTASPAVAQTVIYDGSQPLNYYSASHLTDDLALTNDPNDPTRNGVVSAGADPNVLEVGDAAWFRSAGRRMTNIDPVMNPDVGGLAGAAVGVDGTFMSDNGSVNAAQGAGAGYVLYDANTTTGPQTLNVSVYYNDPTPNSAGAANDMGGSVAVRVWGLKSAASATPADPWGDDRFTFLAGTGFAAAFISAGNHRVEGEDGDEPVVDNLLWYGSSYDAEVPAGNYITPSAEWQQLSFDFDAGTGYDWLIIAVGGVGQNDITGRPSDRYGFDNISFEPAATTTLLGDVDLNGTVEFLDIAPFIAVLSGGGIYQAEADCNEDNIVSFLDIAPFIAILSGQSP